MSDIKRKDNLSVKGVIDIDDDRITIDVEDVGTMMLAKLIEDFNGKEVKMTITYDREYSEEDFESTYDVDEETGELL